MSQEWRLLAVCRGTDPAMWDSPTYSPGVDNAAGVARARAALRYCAGCPVKAACDADAAVRPPVGVIRAGRVYDGDGQPADSCERCGDPIITRNRAKARFCGKNCRNLTLYHAARQERLAAA
ncbi:WhiB family transcriptional regulator [Dactylosporangium sp. CA-139066]|uniref:WhiB family transcriptional regulator n=1 Tax=Dactylosporangium sp. CA-139066 TaxID=3239930 RepID=UPI003D8B2470